MYFGGKKKGGKGERGGGVGGGLEVCFKLHLLLLDILGGQERKISNRDVGD